MRAKFYLLLTILAGGCGYFLRHWAGLVAFDPKTGLALSGSKTLLVLTLFIPAVLLGSLVLALLCPRNGGEDFSTAFEGSRPFGGVMALLAATATAVSGLLALWQQVRGQGGRSLLVLGPVLLAAGLCMIRLTLMDQEGRGRGHLSLMGLVPGFAACVWLVLYYRTHANIPTVMSYALQLVAILCCAAAFYCQAAFYFDRPRLRTALFFSLAAAILSAASVPGCDLLYEKVLLGGMVLWMLCRVSQLAEASEWVDTRIPEEDGGEETADAPPPAAPAPRERPADSRAEREWGAPPRPEPAEKPASVQPPQANGRGSVSAAGKIPDLPPVPEKLDLSFLDDLLGDVPGWADDEDTQK